VVNSLLAVDALAGSDPLHAGLIGSYGNRWTNLAAGEADLLLVLGSRLDIRQTGSDTAFLSAGRRIIHVDCEEGVINSRVTGCTAIVAHLRAFLDEALLQTPKPQVAPQRRAWLARIVELRRQWPDTAESKDAAGINPNAFMHQLAAASGRAGAFIVDVGQHQMWAAQSLDLAEDQRFMTSGGMGAMGFALPAAVGAALADPGRPQVMIAGDGSFQVNIQELQTVAQLKLPIKMVVLDNGCHGMVRQFQQSYFKGRYAGTFWDYSAPDFCKVAQAYGIGSAAAAQPGEIAAGLKSLWKDPQEPFLLQVRVDTYTNIFPKIAFGRPLNEMEPFVQPVEMEGT
jgi:acetolactate synthase-1/2/3 large subunit